MNVEAVSHMASPPDSFAPFRILLCQQPHAAAPSAAADPLQLVQRPAGTPEEGPESVPRLAWLEYDYLLQTAPPGEVREYVPE